MLNGKELLPLSKIKEYFPVQPDDKCIHIIITGFEKLELKKFWDALGNIKVDENNNFFELPENTYFLGFKDQGRILYIRKCYRHLVYNTLARREEYVAFLAIPESKNSVGYYLLYFLAQEKKSVIYQLDEHKHRNKLYI